MRLAHLAVFLPLLAASPAFADCLKAATEYERVAPRAARAIEIINGHLIDWDKLKLETTEERARYAPVKAALDAYLPKLKAWIDAAAPANNFALLCRIDGEITDQQLFTVESAIVAAQQMMESGVPYMAAVVALGDV